MLKTIAVGMTVGVRNEKGHVYDYCRQAVHSFRKAGFVQPLHLFVEPGAMQHVPEIDKYDLRIHENTKNMGCFPNFRRGLKRLRETVPADWYMMLQDDVVWTEDAAVVVCEAMNAEEYQKVGFLSPYTSKSMLADKNAKGWVEARFHNRAFWGALAMCFPAESARRLEEESERYRGHKHHRKLDVVVGNAMRHELKLPIFVHGPSLADHIGKISTLGRHKIKGNAWGRRGYGFKAPAAES